MSNERISPYALKNLLWQLDNAHGEVFSIHIVSYEPYYIDININNLITNYPLESMDEGNYSYALDFIDETPKRDRQWSNSVKIAVTFRDEIFHNSDESIIDISGADTHILISYY